MNQYGVILFHTTSSVMRAEKVLVKSGFATKLIPTPREFSSDCGIALRFEWAVRSQVQQVIDAENIETAGIYQLPPGR